MKKSRKKQKKKEKKKSEKKESQADLRGDGISIIDFTIQSNLFITNTKGTEPSVLFTEVSLLQR